MSWNRDKSITELSQKLQEGWTLLAESCPVCNTPLARSREKRIFCVKCQLFVLTEDDPAAKKLQSRPPPGAKGVSAASTSSTMTSSNNKPAAGQAQRQKRETGGQAGVRSPSRKSASKSNNGKQTGAQSSQKKRVSPEPLDDDQDMPSDFGGYDVGPPVSAEHVARMDKATKQMGDLMLRGWTMMGEHCPDCQCPLMKDKKNDGTMLCCACDQTYVTEDSEAAKRIREEEQRSGGRGKDENSDEQRAQAAPKKQQQKPSSQSAPPSAEEPAQVQAYQVAPQQSQQARFSGNHSAGDMKQSFSTASAAEALKHRITWASEQLRDPHCELQRCRELAKLIHECADALLALQLLDN